MYRLKTFTACLTVVCLAVPLQAYRPTESPKSAGMQKSQAQSSVDPFVRGLKHFRRLTLDDVFDSTQDLSARQPRIKTLGSAGQEVPDRINKRLRSMHSSVRVTRIDRDKRGLLHVRLSQFHRGIPVIGSDMIVHIDNNNNVCAVTGNIAPLLDVDTTASVRLPQARLAAQHSITNGSRSPRDSSRLVVFDGALAYEVLVQSSSGGPQLYKCLVDAKLGNVLYKQNMIMPAGPSGSGTHELVSGTRLIGEGGNVVSLTGWHDTGGNYFFYNKDSVWGVYNLVKSDWEQRPTNSWGTSDPAAVSLAKNFSIIQNYVKQVDGINSFDNAGKFAQANVHEGANYVNAYWDGVDFHFGDGDGVEAGPLTVLDVAAHEYGHAITQYTSNLNYSYESGALNESFSDIHGTLVEFWAEPDGRASYPNKTVGAADWLCGEDCWLSDVALRDLRNPQRYGQPSYYMGTLWYTGGGDNGGVHYNSGVQNFAFYLLAEGGTGSNDGHPYSITGLGIQQAGAIAMYANMYLLTSTAQYRDSRDAWIMAASILGFNASTVADVWTACGVLPLVKHLSVSPASLAFGPVGVGSSDTMALTLSNNGASSTIVSGLTFGDPWFASGATAPFSVPGGGAYVLKVAFNPLDYLSRTSTLTIASNADDNPSIPVVLSGTGVAPAALSLTPMSLRDTVLAGDSAQRIVQCANSGNAPLKIRITKTETDTPVAAWKGEQRWNYSTSLQDPNGQSLPAVRVKPIESAIVTPPFFDGFEQGNFNNWTPGYGSYVRSVTKTTAASGMYSFTQTGGNSTHFDGVAATFAVPQQPDVVSFSVRVPSNSLHHGYFVLCGAGDYAVAWSYMCGTGNIRVNGNESVPYAANTWYNIRFKFHWSVWNFDYYVNNTLITTAIPFSTNAPITTIYLYNYSNSQAWWDNINFGGAPENTWLTCAFDTATIFSGQSALIPVSFNSKGMPGGNYAGSLSIFHNAPANPSPAIVPCTLTVRGVRRLTVAPAAYSFGNVWAGTHASATFTLKNIGTEATQVDSIVCDNPAFAASSSLPLIVKSNDSTTVTVTFSPLVTGPFNGTMSIKSNAEDNPLLEVSVSGMGTAPPAAQLLPTSLAFSLPGTGSPASQVSVLSNIGGDALIYSVTAAEVSRPPQGAPGLAWLSVSPLSGSLSPGVQQNLTVTVNPMGCAAGRWTGRVMVTSNDPVNPQVVLTITADIAGCKKLSCSASNLNFGSVWTGAIKPLTLTLSNSCNDSVAVSALNFTNAVFSSNAVLPLKVPAFGSATLTAVFAPSVAGPASGTMTIASNAMDNPEITLNLNGTGIIPPQISTAPNSFNEKLEPGSTITKTLMVYNLGGDSLKFTSASIDLSTIAAPKPTYDASHFVTFDHGQPDTRIGYPVTTASGGPDSYGYRWIDSDQSGGPAYVWNDISATGTVISGVTGCGDCDAPVSFSMPFNFYGTTYKSCWITTKGFISFLSGTYQYVNYPLPSASAPLAIICAFWDDLSTAANGQIYMKEDADRVTFQWNNIHPYGSSGNQYTFQAVLGIDGSISFYYKSMTGVVNSATVGIQNQTATTGLTVAYNTPYIKNNFAVRIAKQPAWLSIDKLSGVVAPGDSVPVMVTLKALSMVSGVYSGAIRFMHNDPSQVSPLDIPVSLTVNGERHCSASPLTYAFGGLWTGKQASTTITLSNSGNEPTVVSSITSSSPAFFTNTAAPVTVPAFGSATVTVVFAPSVAGPASGTMTIASNAMDNPEIAVSLSGIGLTPPAIAIVPDRIVEKRDAGDSVSRSLTVSNPGGDWLNYRATARYISSPSMVPEVQLPLRTAVTGPPENKTPGDGRTVAQLSYVGQYLSFAISTYGEIMPFQYPVGTEHLMYGTYLSGYTVAYMVGGVDKVAYSVYAYRSGIVPFSYQDVVNDSARNVVEVVTRTADTILEIWQQFTYDKHDRYIRVDVKVKNLSAATVTNVVYKSCVDWDVDNSASGDTFNYDASHFMIYAKDKHFCAVAGATAPDYRDMDGWDDYNRRQTDGDYTSGPAAIDGLEILHYELGALAPGASQSRVLAFCAADSLVQLQNTASKALKASGWLRIASDTGSVAAGSSSDFGVGINATGLLAGTYAAEIDFVHNAPGSASPAIVPCTLTVNSVRHLSLSPDSLKFGPHWTGSSTSLAVIISNSGNAPTVVSSMTSSSPAFFAKTSAPLAVPAFGSDTVIVVFAPSVAGPASGTMTIASNADNPEITISLNGTGLTPPHIAISPQTISERLGAGAMVTKTLTVFNTGGDILHFTSAAIDQSSVATPSPQYAPSHFLPIAHGQADTRIGLPVTTASGGPDSYGYRWIDSDQSGGPAYVWNDISATGTVISGVTGCGDCDASVSFTMPFNFYGTTYTSCWITTKGFISFLSGTYQYSNYPLPSASAPAGIICAFWDDLSTAANGQIYMKEDAGRVTFQWNNIHVYGGSGNQYTFQMVLGTDGSIIFYYKSMTGPLTSATVGIQNQTATTGLTIAYNTTYIKNNLAIKISKAPTWLSTGTQSGSITSGSSVPVPVTLNSTQLTQGVYSAVVRFTHDDPSRVSPLDIPVSLLVSPAGGLFCMPLLIGPSTTGSANGATYRLNSLNVEAIVSGRVSGTQYILRFN